MNYTMTMSTVMSYKYHIRLLLCITIMIIVPPRRQVHIEGRPPRSAIAMEKKYPRLSPALSLSLSLSLALSLSLSLSLSLYPSLSLSLALFLSQDKRKCDADMCESVMALWTCNAWRVTHYGNGHAIYTRYTCPVNVCGFMQ